MSLPFFIARRYLFSKKKHNAINIISGISVCGVALATLALVCTLSVFNGFQDMVAGFFTAFDPELKITVREGKVFDPHEACIRQVHALSEIDVWTETLEENAMVQYKDRQAMAVIKGVEDNFEQLTSIDSLLYGTGKFLLSDSVVDYGFLGVELISELGTGIQFVDPLQVYAPKRNVRVNIANPTAAFNREYLFSPGAIFAVNQQKYDSRYILTSLDFARRLFNYDTEVSAIEMKLKPGSNIGSVQKKIAGILGDRFIVQNRYEQQADVFRIMEIEKLISYLFLTFILGIACFNVIGSLSMLILDKREDVETLRNLGADDRLIARIFLFEGRMISVFGALSGIVLGLLLCFLQQRFGLISLGGRQWKFCSGRLSGKCTCHGYYSGILNGHHCRLLVRMVSGEIPQQAAAEKKIKNSYFLRIIVNPSRRGRMTFSTRASRATKSLKALILIVCRSVRWGCSSSTWPSHKVLSAMIYPPPERRASTIS